jgi:hypothetical protein
LTEGDLTEINGFKFKQSLDKTIPKQGREKEKNAVLLGYTILGLALSRKLHF